MDMPGVRPSRSGLVVPVLLDREADMRTCAECGADILRGGTAKRCERCAGRLQLQSACEQKGHDWTVDGPFMECHRCGASTVSRVLNTRTNS